MKKQYTPRGVTYEWTKDRIEYQLFPEEFFSGADTKIYFGDIFIEDVLSIQFVLQESVKPLYGYASYVHEEVARGRRFVEGTFAIAFRESGFLPSILDHIGQLGNVEDAAQENGIVTLMRGGTKSKWQAEAKQTFEELFSSLSDNNSSEVAYKKYNDYENTIWGRRSSSNLLNYENKPYFYSSRRSEDYQEPLRNGGFDIFITYGPLEEAMKSGDNTVSFNNTVKAIRGVELTTTGQTIETDGTIMEVYRFIAKDID